jgi:hypothetical protein
MRILGSVVAPSASFMPVREPEIMDGGSIRSQVVRDQFIWDIAIFSQQLAHQFQRRALVPPALDQHVEDLTLGIFDVAEAQREPEIEPDRDGRQHHGSLPQGGVPQMIVQALVDRARHEIHPKLAELVAATPDPFVQTIVDVVVPRTVFGRVCLLGDAAFVVRPSALLRIVDAAEPPLRVFFGDAGLPMIKREYAERIATWEKWNVVSLEAQGNLAAR